MACLLPTYHHLLGVEELASTSTNTQSWPPLSTHSIFKHSACLEGASCEALQSSFTWLLASIHKTLIFHIAPSKALCVANVLAGIVLFYSIPWPYCPNMNALGLGLFCPGTAHSTWGMWSVKSAPTRFSNKYFCSRSAPVKAERHGNNSVKLSPSPWRNKQSRRNAEWLVSLHPHSAHPHSKDITSLSAPT